MAGPGRWNSGLCDCGADCGLCWYGLCCTSCLYGANVAKLQGVGCGGPCLLYACCNPFSCIFAGASRGDMRAKYNLPEEPCGDCCVHWCCGSCAVCQEARELRLRMRAPVHPVAYPPAGY